ncbi:MAG: hypothetical protein QM501_07585 [Gimesia sp.]
MKPIFMKHTKQTNRHVTLVDSERHGSTLLIVIALLAMLSLLGVLFYTFASQEERSAQYFMEASLNEADAGIDADVLFNWGLQQLIVGPDEGLHNSALYGKRHALLINMFGSDLHPFSGEGINVIMDGSGAVSVDQNYTGTGPSGNQDFLHLNHSRAAYDGLTYPDISNFPKPDVDYTSPDINNLFLAYDGYTLHGGSLRRVIIPSFVRPQFFRKPSGAHTEDWYENDGSLVPTDNTSTKVLRPHPAHVFVDPGGTASTITRFTSSFPFQPTTVSGGSATQHGELGIFTDSFGAGPSFIPILELDVDNDNDGIREGIWMDLDFPPIQNPNDPTKYMLPLFSFTVHDLDALINLNTAGNMRRTADIDLNYNSSNNFFGEHSSIYTDKFLFLSRSNMGLSSPGEINPQWALNARPQKYSSGGDMVDSASATGVLQQHFLFFGDYPYPYGMLTAPRSYASYTDYTDFQSAYEDTVNWRENSNMEYFFLNFGRPEFSLPSPLAKGTKTEITDLYPGRWGEPNLLYDAQRDNSGDPLYLIDTSVNPPIAFPRAGQTLVDDNGNRYEGGTLSGSLNGNRANVQSFMHPLAYKGSGRTNKTGASYRQPAIGHYGWNGYRDFEFAGSTRYNGGRTFFKDSVTNTSGNFGILMDEADEMTVDLEKVQRPYDEPFSADDLAYLHMNQTDQDKTGISSRLEFLLPFNFGRAATVNVRGNSIRKTFTTMSWDRKQFGMPIIPGFRDWETEGLTQFPPFSSRPDNDDPFRPALRTLLTVLPGNTQSSQLQMKLNLNELLVFDQTGSGQTVTNRPLTPHPGEDVNDNGVLDAGEDLNGNGALDSLSSTVINTSWNGLSVMTGPNPPTYSNLPAYPPTSTEQQEFWARYDRQLKARDIYVLLYTLGGGNNAVNYSTNSTPYTSTELKEMAQFAVNVVDALDPDDVITRFEYDTNLANGWGLDDNPYTTGESNRAEVFGVEAQTLTLSEFLAIKANKVEDSSSNPVNHDATEYDDEKDRYFSFLELRNAGHQTVSFANDAWQIRLEPRTDPIEDTNMVTDLDYVDLDSLVVDGTFNDTHQRRLTLRSGFVDGGDIFNIRSAGDNENTDPMSAMPRESYFRVDPNFTGGAPTFRTIVPADTTGPSLDLITGSETNDFLLTSEADTVTPLATRGDFLNDSNMDPGGTNPSDMKFIVRLMRRAHLGRNTPAINNATDNLDNPWVEVDSMIITNLREFTLSDSSMDTAIQSELNPLQSFEREQPLYARGSGQTDHAAGNAGSSYRANTVGATNSNTGAGSLGLDGASGVTMVDDDNDGSTDELDSRERGWAFSDDRARFNLWQPHFDRDFASKIELLSIPLVGPNRITRDLVTEDGVQTRKQTSSDTSADKEDDVRFAGIQKFLDPNGPNDGVDSDDNRWYRLLEFVEVPTRSHRQLGNPLNDARVPGRINLNTIRHPAVLAALLDDSDAFTMDMSGSAANPNLSATHLGGGNWWRQFIESRDAADTGIGTSPYPRIPGTPGSRPFRSFHRNIPTSAQDEVRDLRENTILRSLPDDITTNPGNPRLLFELTTSAEHLGTAGLNNVDAHTRNRILSKIDANTTTRSNTFIVFMSVAYFEASDTGTTVYGDPVRIGARMSPIDAARTVNDVDYRGFFVIDRTRAEQAFEPSTGQFDHWKRLIRYRHSIQQ